MNEIKLSRETVILILTDAVSETYNIPADEINCAEVRYEGSFVVEFGPKSDTVTADLEDFPRQAD